MVLRIHVFKVIVTSGFLTGLECTEFIFGPGSALFPAGGTYGSPPIPYSWFRGTTSNGEEHGREREGRRGRGSGREGDGTGGTGPLTQIPWSAPANSSPRNNSRLVNNILDIRTLVNAPKKQ